jgi:hypothetical protein
MFTNSDLSGHPVILGVPEHVAAELCSNYCLHRLVFGNERQCTRASGLSRSARLRIPGIGAHCQISFLIRLVQHAKVMWQ